MIQGGKIISLIPIQGKILFEDAFDKIGATENDGMAFTVHGNGFYRLGHAQFFPCVFSIFIKQVHPGCRG
jgi:hypothetical protein